jgi:hypothetical protein
MDEVTISGLLNQFETLITLSSTIYDQIKNSTAIYPADQYGPEILSITNSFNKAVINFNKLVNTYSLSLSQSGPEVIRELCLK